MRTLLWLFWIVVYAFSPRPRDLLAHMKRSMRCRRPWWQWEPTVYYNDVGRFWEIWFSEECSFTVPRYQIEVQAAVTHDGKKIVGLKVFQENLKVNLK